MATKAITIQELGVNKQEHNLVTWETLANGDDGAPFDGPAREHQSIQIQGTLGAGFNLIVEGSNDGSNYHTMNDLDGNSLGSIAAVGIYQIRGVAKYIRPRISGGDGTTAITATLVAA